MSYVINYNTLSNELENLTLEVKSNMKDYDEELDECDYSIKSSFIHILQCEPREQQIKELLNEAPDLSIVYIPELDVYGIGMNAVGCDLSEEIKKAYLKIDKTLENLI